jgi:hypothetical protein
LQNQKFLYAEKSSVYAAQGRASAAEYSKLAMAAYQQIQTETAFYNDELAGGKWKAMMSANPREQDPFKPPVVMADAAPVGNPAMGLAVEGSTQAVSGDQNNSLPGFSVFTRDRRFVDVFDTGAGDVSWTAKASADWIVLSQGAGSLAKDARVWVSVDLSKAPSGDAVAGEIIFKAGSVEKHVKVGLFNPASPSPADVQGFVESDGAVSMLAEHFTRNADRNDVGWRVIKGLGRGSDGVAPFPTTAASIVDIAKIKTDSPSLDYDFTNFHPGPASVTVYAIPTNPIDGEIRTRYAVAFDDRPPQIVEFSSADKGWAGNVMRASVLSSSDLSLAAAGKHTLHVWMVDPGVVLDKIVVSIGKIEPSYLGPPETVAGK